MMNQTSFDNEQQVSTRIMNSRLVLLMSGISLAMLAALRLGYEYWRFFVDQAPNSAVDFHTVYLWTNQWFAGTNQASLSEVQILFPINYLLYWPLLGWLPSDSARILWATLSTLCLIGLSYLIVHQQGSIKKRYALLFFLFILAIYPTGITIGNGQITFLALLPLIIALSLIGRRPPAWRRAFLISPFLILSLIKPHLTLPFFWLILFPFNGWREILLTFLGYAGLTTLALTFQGTGWLANWLASTGELVVRGGYGNVHSLLGALNLSSWTLIASLVIFLFLGLWIYRNRNINPWILIGVSALVARIWTYHRLYDDWLVVLVILALWQARKDLAQNNWTQIIELLILALSAGLLMPGTLLRLPNLLGDLIRAAQTMIWLTALAIFIGAVRTLQHQGQQRSQIS